MAVQEAKLIVCVISFELIKLIGYMATVPQRHRQTDGRLTIAILPYAHCALHGKNVTVNVFVT